MSRAVKIGLVAVGLLVALASVLYVRTMTRMGEFTTIMRTFKGESCLRVEGVAGPEDIAIDCARGIAYVSAYDRRRVAEAGDRAGGVRGGIYVMDLNVPDDELSLRPITPMTPDAFRPHGISLFIGEDGRRTLMAVNHPGGGRHTVEIFDLAEDDTLSHRATVEDGLIVSPNDVAAVSHEAFYVTNDHDRPDGRGRTLAAILSSERGSVVYWDGVAARIVADELAMANGVALSRDAASVYVTELFARTLRIYARDEETGALTLRDRVFLGTGVDNIDVAADGSLWIGAHPKLATFAEHAADPGTASPSQVVVVEPAQGGGGTAWTAYLDDGTEISGASVGATYRDRLVIGAVFDPAVLVCRLGLEVGSDDLARLR